MSVSLASLPDESAPPVATWRERIVGPTASGGWLATLVVAAIAGALRFVRLDLPSSKIFDEVYYACDALMLLTYGVEHDTNNGNDCVPENSGAFVAHPPLGKWTIALGIKAFGDNALGWRFSAAVAGTLMVVVLVRVTRRMTGSTLLGCLAGLLLALDGLQFVQSRTSMLDIFLAFWTTAAFACLVADRDAVRRRLAGSSDEALAVRWGPRLGLRPWRIAAGVCLGAALATKWSGLYFIAGLTVLALVWEVGARRTAGSARPWRETALRSVVPAAAVLVLLPVVLYVASWTGWFLSDLGWDRRWAQFNPGTPLVPDALRSLWRYHVEVYTFHTNLSASHPYQSHPAGWLVLARPVSYYYPPGITAGTLGCTAESCAREILAIGTPAIWWAAIPALLACAWLWLARRDWRAGAVLAVVAITLVPWVREDLDGRTMFLFYALPALPFFCLGLALVAGWALGGPDASPRRRRLAAAGIGVHLSLVVANFAWLYPILAAQTIPYAAWQARMWFSSWI